MEVKGHFTYRAIYNNASANVLAAGAELSPVQHKQKLFWAVTCHKPRPTRNNYSVTRSATATSRHGHRQSRSDCPLLFPPSPPIPFGPLLSIPVPSVPSGMDPAVPRATLKVLALCTALLVLVAAVTVAVAVSLWRSEVLGQLRGCRERAANESRELGTHLGELERDRERLRSDGDTLRRELARAQGDSARDNASLVSCRERAARLEANVTALGNELVALRRERAELAGAKVALQEEVARGAEQAQGLRRRLQEALEQQRELWERRERCEGRQRELQDSLRDYAAELEALRRRARDRGSGRRCPPGHRKG
ncbi:uncharacterized protein LOC135284723 isoform X2 [Passer domesticus]|uniref:uncharacterized protein LOC135284723 isoform X2 n=1 Tax=Passer domesticus TaxID=48849 RepID=UPI0030FF3D8A